MECVGYKDPIGNGQFNMGVTDEPIVRCRECKYLSYDRTFSDGDKSYDCTYLEHWFLVGPDKEPDGFCSWAVRK